MPFVHPARDPRPVPSPLTSRREAGRRWRGSAIRRLARCLAGPGAGLSALTGAALIIGVWAPPAGAAQLLVTSNADSGPGSLRQAITDAASGDTITFSGGMAVTLTTGLLTIDKNLTIDGDLNNDLAPEVTVSGNGISRVFQVAAGRTVILDGLDITAGKVTGTTGSSGANGSGAAGGVGGTGKGGCIQNDGTLYLLHGSVTSCTATGGTGGNGGGGAGGMVGGGVGGAGGTGGPGGPASGGGIYNSGTLFTTPDVAFGGNAANGGSGGNGGGGGGGGGSDALFYPDTGNGSPGVGRIGGAGGSGGRYYGGRGGDGGTAGNPGTVQFCSFCPGSGGNGGNGGVSGPLGQSPDVDDAGSWVLNFAPAVTTITGVTPTPAAVGQAAAVHFTVLSPSGTPTGTVTVSDGSASCKASVVAGLCYLAFSTPGDTTLTATYSGDGAYFGTTSEAVSLTVNALGFGVNSIVIDPSTPTVLYAGLDGEGVYKSSDGGASWTPATTSPANPRVKALVIKPGDTTKLFAATYGGGVFRSLDGGMNWNVACDSQPANPNLLSLAIDATGRLYAGSESGVFVSDTDCATWQELNNGLPH